MSEAVPDDDQPGRDRPEAGPAPPPADAPRPDQSLLRRLLAPSSRALIVMGPVYMLLGWVTLVAFCLLLSTATDGLRPEDLATRVPWGEMFAPLWMRDAAGLAFTLHLLRYRGIGVRAKVTAVESLLNVALSVWFKLAALRRLRVGTGSVRLVCLPIYLSMLVSIFARAVKSAATRPEQRATSNVSMGIGVTHILAITVACKLDGVSSYPSMSWTDTLWPLWLGLGALGVGVVMLACCFAPFLVCFSAAEQRGPTERVLGPTMVVVTLLALLGWACALVGSMNIALWLDEAPDALPTRESLRLLSAAALCALLTGSCLAVIVLLQYQHPTDEDALGDEPAVSLEEMMSRAVKPKYLVRHSSTLYKRQEGTELLALSTSGPSDAPAADAPRALEEGGAAAAGGGGGGVDAHILAAYRTEHESDPAGGDSDVCWICESGPREAVFLECGHAGVCYPCAEKCWSSQRRHGCPMCRQPVTQVVRVASAARAANGQLIVDVLS